MNNESATLGLGWCLGVLGGVARGGKRARGGANFAASLNTVGAGVESPASIPVGVRRIWARGVRTTGCG